MISYLKGKLLKREEDRIVILANGVGYEVFIPPIVRGAFNGKEVGEEGDEVTLFISYYHQERQPRPMLVGFNREAERDFFEEFVKVGNVGPTKAARLISVPIHQIAQAIEERNAQFLVQMKGLGPKLADKIIAHLYGKVGKYALIKEPGSAEQGVEVTEDMVKQVVEVMVKQLGYRRTEASEMVKDALTRKPHFNSPEEIFEEVYRSQEDK
jgi:Holliday junction DNA helicase RuvA